MSEGVLGTPLSKKIRYSKVMINIFHIKIIFHDVWVYTLLVLFANITNPPARNSMYPILYGKKWYRSSKALVYISSMKLFSSFSMRYISTVIIYHLLCNSDALPTYILLILRRLCIFLHLPYIFSYFSVHQSKPICCKY